MTIPEREAILAFLRDCGKPRKLKHIAEALKVRTSDERAALNKRLNAMVRDGQLIRNRLEGYGLLDKMDLIAGRVLGHPDGFGFLRPDDKGKDDDLFLSPKEMRSLLHGDHIAVRVSGYDRKGRREAALVEVLERANHRVVGRLYSEDNVSFVVPDNKRLHQDILISSEHRMKARPGQYVVAEILRQPDRHTQPLGRIVEVLGGVEDPGMAVDVAIRAYDLPYEWPQPLLDEIESLDPAAPLDPSGRLDLRNCAFVTIDGEDARDFDDAVYCERHKGGWRLLVAIADVSHYVMPGTALDEEARLRGTSVYFPQRVVPMLPEVLSNELCSLKPDVERLCMVCELIIDEDGKVEQYRFHEGIIRSAARLTYNQVAAMVIDGDAELCRRYQHLQEHLHDLYRLYQLLHRRRASLGLLDFDSTESQMIFDERGQISAIRPLIRNDAHRLIEEFMLAANVATADFLLQAKIPALFRNHESPKEERLDELRQFLGEFGLSMGGGTTPTARDYAILLEQVRKREDKHLIETVLLRSMPLAVYEEKNRGHFGLAFEAYTHFTSPIRRYPDLLVHRAIRHLLRHKGATGFHYSPQDINALGDSCSGTERRAEEASRDVEQRLKCEYMRDKVGEVFSGTVSSVTGFGLFVELDDIFIEGLIHVTALPNDYYHFDAVGHRLQGERTGKSFRLASRLRVQVMRVDVDERKIDFELAR